MTEPPPPAEPTWDDVLGAIGEEFWKLAPAEFVEAAHRDLVFGVTWQDLVAAVENGAARCYPSAEETPTNDIDAVGRCCCAGCVGSGPCDRGGA